MGKLRSFYFKVRKNVCGNFGSILRRNCAALFVIVGSVTASTAWPRQLPPQRPRRLQRLPVSMATLRTR